MGTHLVRVGEDGSVVPVEAGEPDVPTEWDHMVAMLQECAEQFADYARLHSRPRSGRS
jgi:hypothetical protein